MSKQELTDTAYKVQRAALIVGFVIVAGILLWHLPELAHNTGDELVRLLASW